MSILNAHFFCKFFMNTLDKYPDRVYNIIASIPYWGIYYNYNNTVRGILEDDMDNNCCCKLKNTPRSEETSKLLKNRINRVIGQLNGIQKMLDDNRYCGDILTQIAAAESALQSLGYTILSEHMQTCVIEEVQKGNTDIVKEAVDLMKKLK